MKHLECPYCWVMPKGKSALTRHINEYHSDEEGVDGEKAIHKGVQNKKVLRHGV